MQIYSPRVGVLSLSPFEGHTMPPWDNWGFLLMCVLLPHFALLETITCVYPGAMGFSMAIPNSPTWSAPGPSCVSELWLTQNHPGPATPPALLPAWSPSSPHPSDFHPRRSRCTFTRCGVTQRFSASFHSPSPTSSPSAACSQDAPRGWCQRSLLVAGGEELSADP